MFGILKKQSLVGIATAALALSCALGTAAQTNNQQNEFDKDWNLAVQAAQEAAQIQLGAPPGSDVSKGAVRKVTTAICVATISRMLAAHDVSTAKKFYDTHDAAGDIDGEASTKLNGEISTALDDEFVAADSDQAIGLSTDADVLQKAFDHVDQTVKSPVMRERLKGAMRERWFINRQIADAEYRDILSHATSSWYANGKLWAKIPEPVWEELSDADKGRFKSGIDPETVPGRLVGPVK